MKLCECGCGQATPLARKTCSRAGVAKGQPLRFVHGHNAREQRPLGEVLLSRRRIDGDCWRYTGFVGANGYAKINRDGRPRQVHRLAYETFVGPIPAGLDIDHVKARGCRFRDCFNPAHLEPVTRLENLLRGDGTVGKNARKTHCPNGHPFVAPHVTVNRQGWRRCRTCMNARRRVALGTEARAAAC